MNRAELITEVTNWIKENVAENDEVDNLGEIGSQLEDHLTQLEADEEGDEEETEG